MTTINEKIKIQLVSMVIIFGLFVCNVEAINAREAETYEIDGIEFIVGQHKPEERVNSKKEEVKIINQTIVVDKNGNPAELPGVESEGVGEKDRLLDFDVRLDEKIEEKINEKLGDDKNKDENNLSDDENEKGYFMKTIKEILISIKDLWAELIDFEEKTDERLNKIEEKLE